MTHTILRLPAVLQLRGRSRSSHYRDIRHGLFTQPVHIGFQSVGWPLAEVSTINAARIAGKTEAEVRDLVIKLESVRQTAFHLEASDDFQ
ncbi:MAG: AlpA family phage regulatory protein [Burkholderiales bacterium]|jgi:prophage regulatory protein|nr:AlpA family phage regulatory protein [Burkholderiales bacterium]